MRRRARIAVAMTAAVSLFLAPTLGTMMGGVGRTYDVQTVPPRPVALVFGAAVQPDGIPSPYLQARLDIAADLYRSGKVKVILVSGDNGTQYYDEPTAMRAYLVRQGVPERKVVMDFAGFDTYDSCVRAKRIFGVDSLIAVTQSYHLPRVLTTCRLVGVDTIGVGDGSQDRDRTWWYGNAREVAANWKMVVDVVGRRQPTLGTPETGVKDALSDR